MHSYLKAIGFTHIENRIELDKILGIVLSRPTVKNSIVLDNGVKFTELRYDFADRIGITIRGEYDEKGFFHLEHYFPHFIGNSISFNNEVIVNKRVDTDAYTGMCDDLRLGLSLIFYLQNSIDYVESKLKLSQFSAIVPVTLAALALDGMVLLPIEKSDEQKKQQSHKSSVRTSLIKEAKEGSQEAIDKLTFEDIDTFAMLSRRSKNEDLYSIVESSFIPYGSESDNYTILGTILEVTEHVNTFSNEQLYELLVDCNDLCFSICINKMDLQGEPLPGRRFKGNIWLQGTVHFSPV